MSDAILQLFRSCKIDNDRHVSNFAGLTEQNAYYEGLAKAEFRVRSDKVGESILLSKSYKELLPYTYGRISFDSEFWYYFSVSGLESENFNKTWLTYSIDCWETARYQLNARLGSGRISRTSESAVTLTPYQPQNVSREQVKGYKDYCYLFYAYNSQVNIGHVYYIEGKQLTFDDVLEGNFLDAFGINGADIKGFWLSPFKPNDLERAWQLVPDTKKPLYVCTDLWFGAKIPINVSVPAIYQKQTERVIITDIRGNEVFAPELNKVYATSFNACLDVSPTSCKWTCEIMSDGKPNLFTIPCEPLDIFNDAFTEYAVRQRQTDIQTRTLQHRKEFTNAIASSGQNASFGSAGGPAGALLGLASGFLGASVNRVSNAYYGSQEQAINDAHYMRARDELSLIGSAIVSVDLFAIDGVIKETWDTYTANRVESDVQTFGQYVSISTDDMETYYKGKLTADVEVLGVPDDWKGQIRMRFAGGVEIVN